jgi:hypothetical protein
VSEGRAVEKEKWSNIAAKLTSVLTACTEIVQDAQQFSEVSTAVAAKDEENIGACEALVSAAHSHCQSAVETAKAASAERFVEVSEKLQTFQETISSETEGVTRQTQELAQNVGTYAASVESYLSLELNERETLGSRAAQHLSMLSNGRQQRIALLERPLAELKKEVALETDADRERSVLGDLTNSDTERRHPDVSDGTKTSKLVVPKRRAALPADMRVMN